jgi:hypothetical protein
MNDKVVKDIKPEDKGSAQPAMPEIPPEMAAWAVQKLDVEFPGLNSHAERNNFAAFINKLVEIANYRG